METKKEGVLSSTKDAITRLKYENEQLLKQNEELKAQLETGANQYAKAVADNHLLLEALKSVRSLNLHLYDEGTIGNRVHKEVENAIDNSTKL